MVIKAEGTENNENAEVIDGEVVVPPEDTETLVAIGAEPSPDSEPSEEDDDAPIDGQAPADWVKQLRKDAREGKKALREARERAERAEAEALALKQPAAPVAVTVGPKPTLEVCEFDAEKYETAYSEWMERKRQADDATARANEEQRKEQEIGAARVTRYQQEAGKLAFKDFSASEAEVLKTLSVAQQSCVLRLAKPALFIYAIGKNPTVLAELAAKKDLVDFAVHAAYIEKDINVKTVPKVKAESRLPGGSGALATGGSALEKARDTAAKTGNVTEAAKIRRKQMLAERGK